VLKGLLALAAACALVGVAVVLLRRRSRPAGLQAVGVACLVIVCLVHVCEAFAILPAFGWGQPRSLGHYVDLVAVLLGAVLICAGFLVK
jgi:hypothetical protein